MTEASRWRMMVSEFFGGGGSGGIGLISFVMSRGCG